MTQWFSVFFLEMKRQDGFLVPLLRSQKTFEESGASGALKALITRMNMMFMVKVLTYAKFLFLYVNVRM